MDENNEALIRKKIEYRFINVPRQKWKTRLRYCHRPFDPPRHRQRLGLGVPDEIDVQDGADDREVDDLLDDHQGVVHARARGEDVEDEACDEEQQVHFRR